ncbi:MAG TPA: hypothetical protein PLX35_00730 [Cyclobacteriaceae bacterium]|nr:hypothetical protein [Cyclobacteriaceae bacterium]
MDAKDREIRRLKKLVAELSEENEWLKSPLHTYTIIEGIQGTYSPLLNPPAQELKTVNEKSKACTFQVVVNDIICVKSDRNIKWIYFSKKQLSFAGERLVSDKLQYTGTIENFCREFDSTRIHLCIVSKSVAVNPCYYELNSNQLALIGDTNPHNECNNLAISPKYVQKFIVQKDTLDKMKNVFDKMRDALAK